MSKYFVEKSLTPFKNSAFKSKVGKEAIFHIILDSTLVGILSFKEGYWIFEYSNEYKEGEFSSLVNFPNIDKIYKSKELWPFFSSRIPSLARKKIQDEIKKKGLNENDNLALLSFFGNKTITNPFELVKISQ